LRAARELKENFRKALTGHFKTDPEKIRFERRS
jgi:hypothetical protein